MSTKSEQSERDIRFENLSKAIRQIKASANRQGQKQQKGSSYYSQSGLLPTPAMLESYEDLIPGFSSEFLHMLTAEQKHRQAYEAEQLNALRKSQQFAHLMTTVIAMVILYVSFMVARIDGNNTLASIIAISGFAFLAISSYCNYLSAKLSQKIKNK